MKLVVFFSCLVAVTTASDVIELTDADFASKIEGLGTTLVEFFAPWCGHCKKLAPEYEKAATALMKEDVPIPLVKVDCIANSETCSKFGVSGYPTLKIFRGGEVSSDYSGPRSSDGIVSYMKKQVAPATKQLDSVEDFEKFTSKMNAVVIGFFADAEDADAKAYSSLTSALREDYTFGHTYSQDVFEKAGYSEGVVLFRPKHLANKFEPSKIKMDKEVSENNVKSFLKENLHGLCGHMTNDNSGDFGKPLLTAFYAVDYVKNVKGTNYWRNRVIKYGAKQFGKDFTFTVANAGDFSQLLNDIGITAGEKPVVIIRDDKDRKYVMADDFSPDGKTLIEFIKEYKEGKLKPKIKSEPVPESQDGDVTVVVGENFDEVVMDENKDVLIEFYAPWCGHCKSLAPKWDQLGQKMKDVDDLVIAKIDATANDSPSQFQVSGFPTIYYAPKNGKEKPQKYQGAREVEDFVKFLDKERKQKTEL